MHVPKTGGRTLTSLLTRQYPSGTSFTFTGDFSVDNQNFIDQPESQRQSIVLWLGNAPFEPGIPEADTATVITMLRDPISRVRSFCQHVYEGKSPYLRAHFPPESFDLDAFLSSGNPELANLQSSQDHLDQIAELNQIDIGVYSAAKELFLRNLEVSGINDSRFRWSRIGQEVINQILRWFSS